MRTAPFLAAALLVTAPLAAADLPQGIGWHALAGTELRPHCPKDSEFPGLQAYEGCDAVTHDWSGGAFDTAQNRLLIRGGGHSGYFGNETYAVDLDTLTAERLYDPSLDPPSDCNNDGKMPDGKPQSSHTYNHLAYVEHLDAMFEHGGAGVPCGFFGDTTWLLDLKSLAWTDQQPSGPGPKANFGNSVAYDPGSQRVYARDDYDLHVYDPATNAWSIASAESVPLSDYRTAFIEPGRKRYFLYVQGQATLYSYDIGGGSGAVLDSIATSGCSFVDSAFAGFVYDPVQDRAVAWAGGDSVELLDLDSGECTTVTHPGGPGPALPNGTYGRFAYSPKSNAFIVCNDIDDPCHLLRLDDSPGVGGSGGSSGAAGGGGASGDAGGSAAGGSSGSGGSMAGAGNAGSAGVLGAEPDSSSGCGCRTAQRKSRSAAIGWALLLAWLAVRRRR